METLLRTSSPYSESWSAWIMLLILCVIVLSFFLQPNIIKNSFHNLWENSLRGNQLNRISFTLIGGLLLALSHVLIFSMLIYLCYASVHEQFFISGYLLTCGLFLCMWGVKEVLFRIVSFVFFSEEVLQTYHYYQLTRNTCMCFVGYPMLLLMMFTPWFSPLAIHIIVIVFFSMLFVLTVLKLFRLFSFRILDILYILLYLCTLEMLPFVGWVYTTYRMLGIILL